MTDRVARLACVALVVAAVLGAVATAPGASGQPTNTIAQTQIDPDDVSMRISLRPNGDAAWAIDYRVRLDSNETTDAFLSLREDIRANESRYADQFRTRMASTAATAENATGREMAVRNVSVTATRQQLPQDYGIVSYTFVWTNFSAVDGGTIRAGDALAGLFLDSETSLQFAWPDGYALEAAQPEPTDTRAQSRIVVWDGPLDFGPGEPRLVVTERSAAGTQSPPPSETPTPADSGLVGYTPALAGALVLALVLAAVAGGGFLLWRRDPSRLPRITTDGTGGAASGAAGSTSSGGTAGADADRPTDPDAGGMTDDSAGTTAGSAATVADGDAGAADDASGSAARPWEDELLSNEERVLALVEHEGGRMKQQEVAQTLDWTDAKTSQVVREMREEGDLDAFRLGRENVLVLPDEEFGPEGDG